MIELKDNGAFIYRYYGQIKRAKKKTTKELLLEAKARIERLKRQGLRLPSFEKELVRQALWPLS